MAISGGLAACGHLPLGFGWQAATRPMAVSLSFVPIDVNNGKVRLQRNPLVKRSTHPFFFADRLPVDRMLCVHGFPPPPAVLTPQLAAAITSVIHEFGEFSLRDCRA